MNGEVFTEEERFANERGAAITHKAVKITEALEACIARNMTGCEANEVKMRIAVAMGEWRDQQLVDDKEAEDSSHA